MPKMPKVLVVEDDPTFQKLAKMILDPHAEVVVAGSIAEALSILREVEEVDFVILDGRVPHYPGPLRPGETTHSLARYLRDNFPSIKVYSASGDKDLNEELADLGCIHTTKITAPQAIREEILKNK